MLGQTISHYRILEKIGGGGMGVVFKAEDTRLGRPVAVKFLSEDLARNPQALERFERESRAASALNHPNIATVYDVGVHEGRPFLVMELLESQPRACESGPGVFHLQKSAGQIAAVRDAAHWEQNFALSGCSD